MSQASPSKASQQLQLTPEQALTFLPILGGVLVSFLIAIGGLYPLVPMLQKQEDRLKLYQKESDELPLLRRQLVKSDDQYLQAELQQSQLIALASSTDQLDTILTAMNRIALEQNVQITSLEPEVKKQEDAEGKAKAKKDKKKSKSADQSTASLVENEFFQPQGYQISLSGSFLALQKFLTELETLQTAVLVSDLDFSTSSGSEAGKAGSADAQPDVLTLKMRLIVLRRVLEDSAKKPSKARSIDEIDIQEDF